MNKFSISRWASSMMSTGGAWRMASLILLALSATLFAVGMGLTTVFAPCYQPGAVVTEIALVLVALSFVTLIIAAVKGQSSWAWVAGSAMNICFMLFVANLWTLLLCRGV